MDLRGPSCKVDAADSDFALGATSSDHAALAVLAEAAGALRTSNDTVAGRGGVDSCCDLCQRAGDDSHFTCRFFSLCCGARRAPACSSRLAPLTARNVAGGFAPQWHALLPTPVEARARGSQPPDGGWGPVGIDSGQAKLRKPAGMGQRRVCVCKAEAIEETRSERFSLRAAFKALPEAWRGVAVNAWSSLLAGAVAYTIATPIEAFKVGIQTWPGSTLAGIGRNIITTRGKRGFFNGLDAMLWAGLPYSLVMYGCYQPVKKLVDETLAARGWAPGASGQVLGATIAEILGMMVFIPGELVRMRMMNDPGLYRNFVQAAPTIIRSEGVKTMFTGFGTTLARDIPYTALTFVIFENMRKKLAEQNPDSQVSFAQSMGAGVLTAMVCSTCTIPLDVVKSNVMTTVAGNVNVLNVVRDVFAKGGARAFFKGYLPFMAINSAKWSSSMAVYATAYEHYGGGSMGAAAH